METKQVMIWNRLRGKRVFLRTKHDRRYTGIVDEIIDAGDGIVFIALKTYEGFDVVITANELSELKEESNDIPIEKLSNKRRGEGDGAK